MAPPAYSVSLQPIALPDWVTAETIDLFFVFLVLLAILAWITWMFFFRN